MGSYSVNQAYHFGWTGIIYVITGIIYVIKALIRKVKTNAFSSEKCKSLPHLIRTNGNGFAYYRIILVFYEVVVLGIPGLLFHIFL